MVGRVTAHPLWIALSADIFKGQIIASLIVLTFVAVFLLREWISQNARPGVFEDEELLPDEQPVPVAPQAMEPDVILEHIGFGMEDDFDQQQAEAVPIIDEMHGHDDPNGHAAGEAFRPQDGPNLNKGKTKEEDAERSDSYKAEPARVRRRVYAESSDDETPVWDKDQVQRRPVSRRVHPSRTAGVRRKPVRNFSNPQMTPALPGPSNSSEAEGLQRKFQFTFKAASQTLDSETTQRSSSEPPMNLSHVLTPPTTTTPTTPAYPLTHLAPSSTSLPFSFSKSTTSTEDLSSSQNSGLGMQQSMPPPRSTSSLDHAHIRRPLMPSITMPHSGPVSPLILSRTATPLGSPSIVTYRAPEELHAEAGSSKLNNYFEDGGKRRRAMDDDGQEDDEEGWEDYPDSDVNMAEEHEQYFAELEEDEQNENQAPHLYTLSSSDEERDIEELQDDGADGEDEDEEEEEEDAEGNGPIFEDDGHWDPVDIEDLGQNEIHGGGVVAVNGGGVIQPVAGQQAGVPDQAQADAGVAAALADGNEEVDGNVEDDMEGAMEGMNSESRFSHEVNLIILSDWHEGSHLWYFSKCQHQVSCSLRAVDSPNSPQAALMIFVLDTAIGIGIWIPFTIGKSTALLSVRCLFPNESLTNAMFHSLKLNPARFFQILHLPIRAMRIVTDPFVDTFVYLVTHFFVPPLLRVVNGLVNLIVLGGLLVIGKVFGKDSAKGTFKYSVKIVGPLLLLF